MPTNSGIPRFQSGAGFGPSTVGPCLQGGHPRIPDALHGFTEWMHAWTRLKETLQMHYGSTCFIPVRCTYLFTAWMMAPHVVSCLLLMLTKSAGHMKHPPQDTSPIRKLRASPFLVPSSSCLIEGQRLWHAVVSDGQCWLAWLARVTC